MTPVLQPMQPMTRIERVALVIGLVLAAWLMWPMRDHVTDGTFVHLQYARHLAQGRGPVFNVGEHVYGCTSPLWAALIADAVVLGMDPLVAARVLGALASLATIPLFLQLMRRTVRLAPLRAFATVAWSSNAWMAEWAMSGIETPLAVALMLAGFVAFTEGHSVGSRPVRTGTLWALAALTRPQLVYLLLLWGILLLVDANNRAGLRRLVYGILPPVIVYGTWMLFARLYFGTFWPRALAVRDDEGGLEGLSQLVNQALLTDGVHIALLAAALVFAGRRLWGLKPTALHFLPWLWVLSLPILYATRGAPPLSRRMLVIVPVLAWLAWRAADAWWSGDDPESKPRRTQATVLGLAVAALAVVINLVVHQTVVIPDVRERSAMLREGLMTWGEWFGRHAPSNAAIASTEVGALGYASGRRVHDLTGYLSPQLQHITRDRPDAVARLEFAAVARPTFLVARGATPFELRQKSPYAAALTPLGRAPAPVKRGDPDSVYTFYRIDWSVYESMRKQAQAPAAPAAKRDADTAHAVEDLDELIHQPALP